jgi:hypothetical protein
MFCCRSPVNLVWNARRTNLNHTFVFSFSSDVVRGNARVTLLPVDQGLAISA